MSESVAPLVPQVIFTGKPLFRGYIRSLFALIYRSIYAANSSGIVYAGGSSLWHVPLAKRILPRVAQLLGKPLVGIGLSVGPFKTQRDRQRVAHFLQHFSFLALRDYASYKEAMTMSLPYVPVHTFDLAGLLPAVYGPAHWQGSGAKQPTLGVALCHYERYRCLSDLAVEALREERIKETLVRLAKRENIRIRFYVFNGHPQLGDLELAQEMVMALKPFCPVEILPYTDDPGQMWRHVAKCDALLAVRLHAAIFAYMAHVPFAIVEYHRKCKDFAEDVGLPEIYRFSSAGPDPAMAVEILLNLLRAPQLPEMAPQDAQARAELNFTAVPWYVKDDFSNCTLPLKKEVTLR